MAMARLALMRSKDS